MRHLVKAAWILVVALLPAAAHAQELAGTVRDSSRAVLPGVIVEAASPVLIEKARSTVTDGTGQYRITNLRPGTYTVTFSLQGFTVTRREGVEVTGAQVFTINAELRVGGLQETVTVTGETPIVDVQTAVRRQNVLDNSVIAALPSSRGYGNYLATIPAIQTTGANNVGGNPNMSFFTAMGGRSNEGTVQLSGMNVGSAFNGGGVAAFGYDMTTAAEVQITITGGLADVDRGGPAFNIIPREGGNSFAGTAFGSWAGSWSQGTNLDDELRAFGIVDQPELIKSWDGNFALGGPLKRDRLWFFGNVRTFGNHSARAGLGWNANAGDPTRWDYVADNTKEVRNASSTDVGAIRLTGQPTPRNKLGVYYDYQMKCTSSAYSPDGDQCRTPTDEWTALGSLGGFGSTSPEAADSWDDREKIVQATWSSPVTSRLLLEAGLSSFNSRWGGQIPSGAVRLIRVTELSPAAGVPVPNFSYRGCCTSTTNDQQHNVWRASGSYVTGSHNVKVGYQAAYQVIHFEQQSPDERLAYTFLNGSPTRLQMRMTPFLQSNRTVYHALFAQDQWTLNRLTVQGGLRYERAFSFGPGGGENGVLPNRFLPEGLEFPRTDGVRGLNDVSPRFGAAYDVFGNGRTAVKMHWSHYLQSASNDGIFTSSNPAYSYQWNTNRSWSDLNGNFTPDCDLMNPALQVGTDVCGPWTNANFGSVFSSTTVDPAVLSGWQTRPYDWQIGFSVQQEVLPRVSVELGYNRRTWGNFLVEDNRALGPEDFDAVTITAPNHPQLPDGGGYPVTFLVQTPDNFGQEDAFLTFSDNYADRTDYWHGVDVNVSARMGNGLTLQAGTNTGRGVRDQCELLAVLPENEGDRLDSCAVTESWQTTFRGLASYTIPKIDVLVSSVFRSNPNSSPSGAPASTGSSLDANYTVTNAQILAALGRPLPGNARTTTVDLLLPNQVYGERLNAMDLRLAKIVRFGGTRATVGLDLYNAFNANTATGYNEGFGADGATWLRPTSILDPRFVRFNVTIDY